MHLGTVLVLSHVLGRTPALGTGRVDDNRGSEKGAFFQPLVVGAVNADVGLVEDVQPVIESAAEACASEDVADGGGDDSCQNRVSNHQIIRPSSALWGVHTFPDVQRYRQTRRAEKQAHWDEEHVCHHVFESKGDKRKDWPPHANYLGCQVLRLQPQVASQANQPVAANGAQEDLVELEIDLLLFCIGDGLVSIRAVVKDATVCRWVRTAMQASLGLQTTYIQE